MEPWTTKVAKRYRNTEYLGINNAQDMLTGPKSFRWGSSLPEADFHANWSNSRKNCKLSHIRYNSLRKFAMYPNQAHLTART